MEWLNKFTEALKVLLAFREAFALIAGTIIAIAGTQYIKFQFTDMLNRRRIVLCTLPLGFLPCYIIWPAEYGWQIRTVMGLLVGFSAPLVYKAGIWLISLKWPEFAARRSADL